MTSRAAVPSPAPAPRPTASGGRGTLVLIGGALDADPEIIGRIVSLAIAGRRASDDRDAPARVAILTTASAPARSSADLADEAESDEADGRYYARIFAAHGAVGVPIPVGASPEPACAGTAYSRRAADDATVAETVLACDAVFLGGGDQSHYLLALTRGDLDVASAAAWPGEGIPLPGRRREDTPVLAAVRAILARGGVVAGTSAGLAIQQGPGMVTGGSARTGWEAGVGTGYADDDALRQHPAGGFGFFAEGLLDSHFTEWGRLGRAPLLARAAGQRLVIGVDEHAALVYDRGTRIGEVIGAGGASIVDLAEAEWSDAPLAVVGARWSHCTAGDRIDFARELIERAGRVRVAPGERRPPSAPPVGEVWAEGRGPVLLELARALLASSSNVATADTAPGGFRFSLLRDRRTTWTEAGGFSDLRIDITPIPTHD
ncbi:hypothetical protein D3248_14205 [Leucobacter zeae]|nr:hypothetical protein [Leucobacter zeae]